MPGNAYNTVIATPCHYYDNNQVCHAGIVIAIGMTEAATVRQLDGLNLGLPILSDHANLPHLEDLSQTQSWHYPAGCTNTSS